MRKLYKLIPLTQGKFAIVDARDFEWLNQWRWFAWRPNTKTQNYYARRRVIQEDGSVFALAMHNLILGTKEGKVGDHWNGCTLDNRRRNLRHLTRSENKKNVEGSELRKGCPEPINVEPPAELIRPLGARNTTGYENVFRMKDKWGARIVIRGKTYYLGIYDSPEEAATAYEEAKVQRDSNPRWRPKIKLSSRNTSGHRGISWHKAAGKWRVTTTVKCEEGKRHLHIGSFTTLREAKSARRKYELSTVGGV